MGGNTSKHEPPQLLSRPWREINWTNNEIILQSVKNHKPPGEGQQIRILLHGPAGAGKSSFINTVQSVLLGRMYHQVLVDAITSSSFTRKYTAHPIRKDQESFYPFVFSDIMGLEDTAGVLVDDVKLVLDGRVKDGYRFCPEYKLSEDSEFYNTSPAANDRVHVLVCVVPADTVDVTKEKILCKIKEIRKEATVRNIPQIVILTKIDKLRPEIQEDLRNVYRHPSVKEKMEQFSVDTGIPLNCIFPVKNYHEEIHLNSDVDSLILSALTHIIHAGGDHVQRINSRSE